jgi:hypothetical protein
MHWVNMMVFITHCWKSAWFELLIRTGCLLGACLLAQTHAWGQSATLELTQLRASRLDNALVLNTQLKLELGPVVEDALVKGLAVHFMAEAELMRDRWYWFDRKVGVVTRYYRLAFQPLTRRWRLNVSSDPISGTSLAGSISQSFKSLSEALGVIQRQSNWKVADASEISLDSRQYVLYRFKLDVSQLPRPFQIAAGNQTEWNLQVATQLRLSAEMVR